MRYDGDGEFVAGAFRSIRAFSSPDGMTLKPVTYRTHVYEVGKEYKARCEIVNLDWDKVRKLFPGAFIPNEKLSLTANWDWGAFLPKAYIAKGEISGTTVSMAPSQYERCKIKNNHSAPQMGCQCGFYSFYTKELMLSEPGKSYLPVPSLYTFGVVENSGRVVHCEYGLRSEKIKILGVAYLRDIDDLIKQFPLDTFTP